MSKFFMKGKVLSKQINPGHNAFTTTDPLQAFVFLLV